jgi:hypothetical protein
VVSPGRYTGAGQQLRLSATTSTEVTTFEVKKVPDAQKTYGPCMRLLRILAGRTSHTWLQRFQIRSTAKVKPVSPNHRLVIALVSPNGAFETGLPIGSSEKSATKLSTRKSVTLSPVRFASKILRIAAISRDFPRNAARFLCSSDCVAEREGFEPQVRFRSEPIFKTADGQTDDMPRRA